MKYSDKSDGMKKRRNLATTTVFNTGTKTYTYTDDADYVLTTDFWDVEIGPLDIEPNDSGTNTLCYSRVITAFEIGFWIDSPDRGKIEIEMTKANRVG